MGTNETLGLKSIAEYNKKSGSEMIGEYLRLGWVFERWYEKLILIGLGVLGLWKLLNLVGIL